MRTVPEFAKVKHALKTMKVKCILHHIIMAILREHIQTTRLDGINKVVLEDSICKWLMLCLEKIGSQLVDRTLQAWVWWLWKKTEVKLQRKFESLQI